MFGALGYSDVKRNNCRVTATSDLNFQWMHRPGSEWPSPARGLADPYFSGIGT